MGAPMSLPCTVPGLSVVVPTYNAGRYVAEAIASVLNQDFMDFELLIVDDGSTDDTALALQPFGADERVRMLRNERNMGLIATLHRAYAECRAPLIARMDSDDICDLSRFSKQVAFLRANPDVGIVGGAIRFFGNVAPNVFSFPTDHSAIRPAMLFFCPLAHPALMFRRELVDQGLLRYENDFRHAEDYHLWSRLLLRIKAANLPDVVLDYRLHAKQVSSSSADKQYAAALRVRGQMLQECGVDPTEEEVALHESVILERPLALSDYHVKLANWFHTVESANLQSRYWDAHALHTLFQIKFLETARRTGSNLRQLASNPITGHYVSSLENTNSQKQSSLIANVKRCVKTVLWRIATRVRRP
jgi:GT2 family glycosyltransferase